MALLREIGTAKKVISTTALLLISTITIWMSIRIYQSVNRIISPFRYNRMTDKKWLSFFEQLSAKVTPDVGRRSTGSWRAGCYVIAAF